jgi:hypothetical protein
MLSALHEQIIGEWCFVSASRSSRLSLMATAGMRRLFAGNSRKAKGGAFGIRSKGKYQEKRRQLAQELHSFKLTQTSAQRRNKL